MTRQAQYEIIYIGGEWLSPAGGDRIAVISPVSEQEIAAVASAGRDDVDRAVAAARHAFDHGPWPRWSMAERVAAVERLKDEFVARSEEMAELITLEMGGPITFSRTLQATVPVCMLETFIEIARSMELTELRRSTTGNGLLVRAPKGVVAAIVPWNVPMMTTMMKLGPALLMGCCVILKPAPETSLSAHLLAEILQAAGMANHSIYGLNGAVFSADIDKAVAIASRIRTGTVEINGGGVGLTLPIGGVKQSGMGREGGVEGFEPYTEIKTIGLPKSYADALA